MIKDRFRKWGFKKKITKFHVEAMVRKQSKRQQSGKETVFQIHGRKVTLQKLNPYWRRFVMSLQYTETKDPPSPKDLICLTPPPVCIAAPDEMAYHHRLMRSVQDYCIGNLEAHIWIVPESRVCQSILMPERDTFNQFNIDLACAREFARSGDLPKAQRSVELVSPSISKLSMGHYPGLVTCLLWHMKQPCYRDNPELRATACRAIARAAKDIKASLGANNPLCSILDYFSDEEIRFDELYRRLWKCWVDSFTDNTGPECFTTTDLTSDYNQEVLMETDSWSAITNQEQLAQKCASTYGAGHRVTFNARVTLASCLHRVGRTPEAERKQLEAVADFDISQDATRLAGLYSNGLTVLATYQKLNGKPDDAEANLREACRNCWVICGKSHSWTLNALAKLKQFLGDAGKSDAVKEVEVQITEAMEEKEKAKPLAAY